MHILLEHCMYILHVPLLALERRGVAMGSDGLKLWICLCAVGSSTPHSAPNTGVLLLPIPCLHLYTTDYYDYIG